MKKIIYNKSMAFQINNSTFELSKKVYYFQVKDEHLARKRKNDDEIKKDPDEIDILGKKTKHIQNLFF